MVGSWTLVFGSDESLLDPALIEIWRNRGVELVTEEQAVARGKQVSGLYVCGQLSEARLSEWIHRWETATSLNPLFILLDGPNTPHGLADQIQAAFGAHRVDVVRFFLFEDRRHAAIGGDLTSNWVRILRHRLAEEEIISMICKRIEVDEIAACLPIYLEWKNRFYTFLGERCDQSSARLEVVSLGLGMDKRVGQGWHFDHPTGVSIQPIERKEWLHRELQQLPERTVTQTVAVWSGQEDFMKILPDIRPFGQIKLFLTKNRQIPNNLPGHCLLARSPHEALVNADLLIILDTNRQIREMPPETFGQAMRRPVILDACSSYPLLEMEACQIAYRTLGEKTNVWNGTAYNRV